MLLNSEMLNAVSSKRFSSSSPGSKSERFAPNEKSLNINLSGNEGILKIREEMERKRSLENKISRINRSISASVASRPSTSDIDPASNSSNLLILPIQSEKRSMSEITNLSRFADFGSTKYRGRDYGNGAREEKRMRLWLPIARRTVQWFAGRERRSESPHGRPFSHV